MPYYNKAIRSLENSVADRFSAVKEEREIKTAPYLQHIETIALDALKVGGDIFDDATERSPKAKAEALDKVKNSLQSLSNRIYQAKSFWEKLCYYIGLSPSQEKTLHTSLKAVDQMQKLYQSDSKTLWNGSGYHCWITTLLNGDLWALDQMHQSAKNQTVKPHNLIKYAVSRLGGKTKFEGQSLYGQDFRIALSQTILELKGFINCNRNKMLDFSLNKLQTVVSRLEQGLKYLCLIELAAEMRDGSIMVDPALIDRNQDNYQKRVADVHYEIQKDALELEAGRDFILPVGLKYQGAGHAVIFSIEHQLNGKYTFTINNTGDGSGSLDIINFSSIFGKGRDDIFKDLSLDEVSSPELIELLIKFNNMKPTLENVEAYLNLIVEHFKKLGKTSSKEEKAHVLQTNNVCAYDVPVCWMEKKIEPVVFKCIELFKVLEAINSFKIIPERNWAPIKAIVDSKEFIGTELRQKLLTVGLENFDVKVKSFRESLESARKDNVKNQLDALQREDRYLSLKYEKWNARKDKTSGDLGFSIVQRKETYKIATNQVAARQLSAPGIFAGSELKKAWKSIRKNWTGANYKIHAQDKARLYAQNRTRVAETIQRLSKQDALLNSFEELAKSLVNQRATF